MRLRAVLNIWEGFAQPADSRKDQRVEHAESRFRHRAVYTLPDGTRVVALWSELGDSPRWWFVAEQGRILGLFGDLKLVMYPDGRVYNAVPEPDPEHPEIYIPQPSDLCFEDIRVAENHFSLLQQ
jgi:hypothetical protein